LKRLVLHDLLALKTCWHRLMGSVFQSDAYLAPRRVRRQTFPNVSRDCSDLFLFCLPSLLQCKKISFTLLINFSPSTRSISRCPLDMSHRWKKIGPFCFWLSVTLLKCCPLPCSAGIGSFSFQLPSVRTYFRLFTYPISAIFRLRCPPLFGSRTRAGLPSLGFPFGHNASTLSPLPASPS